MPPVFSAVRTTTARGARVAADLPPGHPSPGEPLCHLILGLLLAADDRQHRSQAGLPACLEELAELRSFVAHNPLTPPGPRSHSRGAAFSVRGSREPGRRTNRVKSPNRRVPRFAKHVRSFPVGGIGVGCHRQTGLNESSPSASANWTYQRITIAGRVPRRRRRLPARRRRRHRDPRADPRHHPRTAQAAPRHRHPRTPPRQDPSRRLGTMAPTPPVPSPASPPRWHAYADEAPQAG